MREGEHGRDDRWQQREQTKPQLKHYMVDQKQKGWVAKLPHVRFSFNHTVNAFRILTLSTENQSFTAAHSIPPGFLG